MLMMLNVKCFYFSWPVSHPMMRCFSCAVRHTCRGLSQADLHAAIYLKVRCLVLIML